MPRRRSRTSALAFRLLGFAGLGLATSLGVALVLAVGVDVNTGAVAESQAFAQYALNEASRIPNLGASGAISGVLAAYLVLFPRASVRVMMGLGRVVAMPALIVIGLWIVIQLVSGVGAITTRAEGGGVAYAAHVGGFFAGLLLTFVFRGRSSYSRG